MRHYHGKQKVNLTEFRKVLEGRVTEHHKLMLRIHKNSISYKDAQLKSLYEAIDKVTKAYHVEIDLLQTIPGIGKDSAISIIS